MRKLAIIGASELQNPLILKAREMGLETHVFAWKADDVGETTADVFHPISIIERDAILEACRKEGIDGICTIASDLANIAVGYVSHAMGLPGNSPACVEASTDKRAMRACFESHGCPSPKSRPYRRGDAIDLADYRFPIIVKPIDRSGSRGVTELESAQGIDDALAAAWDAGFDKTALVEEFAEGREFSVEGFSWQGRHTILAITEKFTTGSPHFIERGHLQPARLSAAEQELVEATAVQALDALDVTMGASHTELKLDDDGTINLIEVGSRMGGDCIGSDLVPLTCGIDYVGAVVDAALGDSPDLSARLSPTFAHAAVKYLFDQADAECLQALEQNHPGIAIRTAGSPAPEQMAVDSSTRGGFAVLGFDSDPDTVNAGLW